MIAVERETERESDFHFAQIVSTKVAIRSASFEATLPRYLLVRYLPTYLTPKPAGYSFLIFTQRQPARLDQTCNPNRSLTQQGNKFCTHIHWVASINASGWTCQTSLAMH